MLMLCAGFATRSHRQSNAWPIACSSVVCCRGSCGVTIGSFSERLERYFHTTCVAMRPIQPFF